MTTMLAPRVAEQIQTACRAAESGSLSAGIDGGTSGDAGGSTGCDRVAVVHLFETDAFLLIPDDADALTQLTVTGRTPTAMVEVIDRAPVPMREPVRSLIWLSGTLNEVPDRLQRELAVEIAGDHPDEHLLDVGHGFSLVRLALGSAVIATASGACGVDVDELASAQPDRFWEYEADWLRHLDADHPDLVEQLSRHLPASIRGGRVRPLRLDRFGITLRAEVGDRDEDVRIPFPQPATCVPELSAALASLTSNL
ncbi:DUF2470 domain-containing protein [Gordonia shandongensis]|uniref:DUF2470 domain-containing protein n=1 Tax=Gordonia shandongensis TaxID=376351 RepID=UPI000416D417|nr:DUF2470 domain-containing protein [Gordonia shandongensis]